MDASIDSAGKRKLPKAGRLLVVPNRQERRLVQNRTWPEVCSAARLDGRIQKDWPQDVNH